MSFTVIAPGRGKVGFGEKKFLFVAKKESRTETPKSSMKNPKRLYNFTKKGPWRESNIEAKELKDDFFKQF